MEHPILFTGDMVQAILADRKTQTRRVVTKQNSDVVVSWDRLVFDDRVTADNGYLHVPCEPHPDEPQDADMWTRQRVYPKWTASDSEAAEPGDKLWVREKWRPFSWHEGFPLVVQYADLSTREIDDSLSDDDAVNEWTERITEQCCGECEAAGLRVDEKEWGYIYDQDDCPLKWRPSIHMPRWACRITLEVLDVRVERVQDIAPADCEAEGITGSSHASPARGQPYEEYRNGDGLVYTEPRAAFRELWDSINATRGYSWESNPWVWVITFRRLSHV